MAYFSGVIRSQVLSMDTGLGVILPYDRPAERQQEPCKVLYLLHGLGDNCQAWTRYTAIETYARRKGIAVIMPEVQRSFYFDMAHGMNYFTYITVELPALCSRMFGIAGSREDTYVAGLSMGGYGALKCGFVRNDLYRGCASFSGALDIHRVMADNLNDRFVDEFLAVLGKDLTILDQDNLYYQAERIAALPREKQPDVYITCGTEDFLHDNNRRFCDCLETLPLDFTYQEWPGVHDWFFWDESIRRTLDRWFPEDLQ